MNQVAEPAKDTTKAEVAKAEAKDTASQKIIT